MDTWKNKTLGRRRIEILENWIIQYNKHFLFQDDLFLVIDEIHHIIHMKKAQPPQLNNQI